MTYYHIAAAILLLFSLIDLFGTPFLFGNDRGTYNPKSWLIGTVLKVLIVFPVIYYVFFV